MSGLYASVLTGVVSAVLSQIVRRLSGCETEADVVWIVGGFIILLWEKFLPPATCVSWVWCEVVYVLSVFLIARIFHQLNRVRSL